MCWITKTSLQTVTNYLHIFDTSLMSMRPRWEDNFIHVFIIVKFVLDQKNKERAAWIRPTTLKDGFRWIYEIANVVTKVAKGCQLVDKIQYEVGEIKWGGWENLVPLIE